MSETAPKPELTSHCQKIGATVALGVLAVGGLAFAAIQSYHGLRETMAKGAFSKEYTQKGDCLYGTPFDTRNGADIVARNLNGQLIVSVIPQAANSTEPSMLNFLAEGSVLQPNLYYSDHQTAAALIQAGCEVPQGT